MARFAPPLVPPLSVIGKDSGVGQHAQCPQRRQRWRSLAHRPAPILTTESCRTVQLSAETSQPRGTSLKCEKKEGFQDTWLSR